MNKATLLKQGHTLSCAYNIIYGDGECECGGGHGQASKTPDGIESPKYSDLIHLATHPRIRD